MHFVDEAKIYVKAGDGGRGCVSFRREKYVPRGGPDGGDGGKGGDVAFRADRSCRTLLDLRYRQHHVARPGGAGSGANRTGRNAPNVVILVPPGTVVKDAATGAVLADLDAEGAESVAVRGGRGGKGNAHFATATRQTPRFAQPGEPGEERWLRLELKLLADAGLIGLPNAGKSTLLSRLTAARPKIAPYPFTTVAPHLGVADLGGAGSLVLADIPGLIAGAHAGAGMGIRFLRHIERTRILVHLLDIARDPGIPPWDDYQTVNEELVQYSPALREKPQVVVFTKLDLPDVRRRLEETAADFAQRGIAVYPCSAATGEGLPAVLARMVQLLNTQGEEAP